MDDGFPKGYRLRYDQLSEKHHRIIRQPYWKPLPEAVLQ
jgi:hypothetical protein